MALSRSCRSTEVYSRASTRCCAGREVGRLVARQLQGASGQVDELVAIHRKSPAVECGPTAGTACIVDLNFTKLIVTMIIALSLRLEAGSRRKSALLRSLSRVRATCARNRGNHEDAQQAARGFRWRGHPPATGLTRTTSASPDAGLGVIRHGHRFHWTRQQSTPLWHTPIRCIGITPRDTTRITSPHSPTWTRAFSRCAR